MADIWPDGKAGGAAIGEWPWLNHTDLARDAECFETPLWAVHAILDVELLTPMVVDPCCGQGVLAKAADQRGYHVFASDLYDWGYGASNVDFLENDDVLRFVPNATVFMNPPFSLAVDFVETAIKNGARKVVCFQRLSWWSSAKRVPFWSHRPPNRIYVCTDRASCWRIDIPPHKRTGGTTTDHAWFVWERGQPGGTQMGRISKAPSVSVPKCI